MKSTQYFSLIRQCPDRAVIKDEWILYGVKRPVETEVQSERRIGKWRLIAEVGKYMRVVLLEDGETVHNAFFDRDFGEGKK